MKDETKRTGRKRYTRPYMWLINALGGMACVYALFHFPSAQVDLRFLLLASLTDIISSRVSVRIPRANTTITVSDVFIFLTMLLYDPEGAILVAAAEGMCSGLRLSKTPRTVLFNAGAMSCATFLTTTVLHLILGPSFDLRHHSYSIAITAVCVMGLVQYIANTGLVAVCLALKSDQPFWPTWSKHYLWSSITYFAGAAVAGLIVSSVGMIGVYAVLLAIPMISILYFTYYKYLEDIRATAAQAEQSERERAEAEHARAESERERAEQAERYVEELNRHLAEQERISRELEESREHFRHVAFHDTLTGLPNRALLIDHLKRSIERARLQPNHIFALIFLDLDRFKNINDSLGHASGDQLLISVARRLEDCLRPMDTVARLGGDEFAILLDGLEDYTDAIRIAERAQQELNCPMNLNGHEVYTTASLGITLSTIGYGDPENILRDADTAMYHAKEKGKARYEMFDAVMHSRAVERLQLENDLRRAVEREEFLVYYQPIVSLERNVIEGFEALVRWEHPQRGMVSPADFIAVAEETGLIIELGRWVLSESCRQVRAWQLKYPGQKPLMISVNLSGKQFTQPNLIEQIKQILQETELDPRCLKLEITESVVMENADIASSMLLQLRALGVQISIDDFGTGYSSLSYLHSFPVNTLKIDRSFISRMGSGDENTEIVRTIIALATNLGMNVVAEGVETHRQLEQLKGMKCDYGQGYLFSKPLNAEVMGELLQGTHQQEHDSGFGQIEQNADLISSSLVM